MKSFEINIMNKNNNQPKFNRKKFLVTHKFDKTSILSMFRKSQISKNGLNEILPTILMRRVENIKKIKKKKQNKMMQANYKQIKTQSKRGK
ncbi:MAG: hypothetical protein HGGPFJEG_00990 [Ignavibacteria bacterium]|nr:hypothetical protein [Ignavibacteria bacterium]